MKQRVSLTLIAAAFTCGATADDTSFLEEITIVGERSERAQVTGAAQYLGPTRLAEFAHADIQRILREVPGVSVQVEDGYGLRPNISIRGVATERSGRITLLEDNVLIAPAPYSAPSAYYFPTAGRMHAIEVVKGPAAITQGPYTIGGALNMVSTPIPDASDDNRGNVLFETGEDSTHRVHATYGGTTEAGLGFLLETHQWRAGGFQQIDRHGDDTGLDLRDYTAKLGYTTTDERHSVELKLQYAEQDSDQSYLGLTDRDFSADAYRRYGVSALDNIHTEHEQQILRYRFRLHDDLTFTATAYNNEHERNWFKTEGIDFDGSDSAEQLSRTSWNSVVQAVNRGAPLNGLAPEMLQAILDGTADTPAGSIQIRANAREYFSRGVQLGLRWRTTAGAVSHDIEFGLRLHEDEEDRLQRNSAYHQQGGRLVLSDPGMLGNAGNRIQEARALAFHVHDRIEFGNWVLSPGVRYEDIEQKRTRFETRHGRTDNPAARTADNLRDTRANDTRVWLPGMGALYDLGGGYTLVAGVHKGFTAPSNAPGVREEKALNYELGFRFAGERVEAEAIAFLSDYDNILGECTASSGSDCTIGDAFNGDAATVQGLELMFSTNLARSEQLSVPLSLSYTYISSEFDSDIADTDFFGDVAKGDPIPYIPEHQLTLNLGLEVGKWSAYVSLNHVDEVCTRAACNTFEQTDASTNIDLAAHYEVSDRVSLFGRIDNVTGTEDILGRAPYGARPNKARTASLGVQLQF